jgi:hypothetical protein
MKSRYVITTAVLALVTGTAIPAALAASHSPTPTNDGRHSAHHGERLRLAGVRRWLLVRHRRHLHPHWKGVGQSDLIAKELAVKKGPDEVTPTMRRLLRGYVDGYNRYLASVGGPTGSPTRRARANRGCTR